MKMGLSSRLRLQERKPTVSKLDKGLYCKHPETGESSNSWIFYVKLFPFPSVSMKPRLLAYHHSKGVQYRRPHSELLEEQAEQLLHLHTHKELEPVLKPVMVRIKTLNELSQLHDSGFGRPPPRHGLNLLYWFAHDYVELDSYGHMVPMDNPKMGHYGFHVFSNYKEDDGYLLPRQNRPYYEVGNLNVAGAEKLPQYVRKYYTHRQDGSNKDRIIVDLNDGFLESVYVTEHTDQTRFGHTFKISQGLIQNIKRLTREDFFEKTDPLRFQNQHRVSYQCSMKTEPNNESWWSWCTIL